MSQIDRLQKKMKALDIGVAVLRLPENVVALSRYWPRNGFSFIVVAAEGDPWLIVPSGDEVAAVREQCLEVKTFGWARLVDGDPISSIDQLLREFMEMRGIKPNGKVGVEMGFDQASPSLCAGEMLLPGTTTWELVSNAFATNENKLISMDQVMSEVRSIKSSADIERIRVANQVAKSALQAFEAWIVPGVKEIEIAARIEAEVAVMSAEYSDGSSSGRAWSQVSSGEGTALSYYPGGLSTNRVIQDGDFVMIELAVVVNGYWCDLTRTYVCGTVSEKQKNMLLTVQAAQMSAIGVIRDGVAAAEVDRVARDIIEQAGYGPYFVHHTGHGVGYRYHEPMSFIAPDSQDILQSGMVVTVEPGIYIPGVGGVRIEDNILVQRSGAMILE